MHTYYPTSLPCVAHVLYSCHTNDDQGPEQSERTQNARHSIR